MAKKDWYYCTGCNELLGEQSDDTLILRKVFFDNTAMFRCKICGFTNNWKSVNEVLRQEANSLAMKLAEVQTEQNTTMTQLNSEKASSVLYKQQLDKEKTDHAATKAALAAALIKK